MTEYLTDYDKSAYWYRQQIKGLLYILKDACNEDSHMIARSYIQEKLLMILTERGVNFHPVIKELIEEEQEKVFNNI